MKNHRGTAYRAVAYVTSAVMIAQALLSPVSTVYAAGESAASQEVVASDVSAANLTDSAQQDDATAQDASVATTDVQESIATQASTYNPDAAPIEVNHGVTMGLYKKNDNNVLSDPLGENETVTSDQTIYGEISINFTDDERPTLEHPNVSYQLPSNIKVKPQTMDLTDNGRIVGTTTIDADGKVTIKYNEDYFDGGTQTVSEARFKFEFALAGDPQGDGGSTDISFPGAATVTVHAKDGGVSGKKFGSNANNEWEQPAYNAEDGTYTWTIRVSPQTYATDLVITDELGSNLSYVEDSFQLVDKAGNPVGGTCDAKLDGQKAQVSLGNLPKGDYYVRYKTKVKADALEGLKDGQKVEGIDNKASWSWGSADNRQNSGEASMSGQDIKYELVSKSADGSSTPEKIKWTVKLNSGTLKADMGGYKFTDTLDKSQNQEFLNGENFTLTADDGTTVAPSDVTFTDGKLTFTFPDDAGKRSYTLTYYTKLIDASSKDEVKNTAKITTEEPSHGPEKGEGTGTYKPTDNATYIEKKLDSAIDGKNYDGKASWTSTIDFGAMSASTKADAIEFWDFFEELPSGVTASLAGDVSVKAGDAALAEGVDYTLTKAVESQGAWGRIFTIKFKDSETVRGLIGKKGATVTVSYTTETSQVNGAYPDGTYKNCSSIQTNKVGEKKGEASFKKEQGESEPPAVTKKQTDVSWNAEKQAWIVDWEVHVNCLEQNWQHRGVLDLKGHDVTVADVLPEGMTYVDGSAQYLLCGNDGTTVGWYPELHPTTSVQDGKQLFTISTKEATKDGSWKGYIKLTYKTEVKASEIAPGESKTFANSASASSDGVEFPEGSSNVTIENKVLDKQGEQKDDSGLVTYTIKVNENALKLNNGNPLVLEDVMGPTCSYAGSLKVYDSGTGKELDVSAWSKSFAQVKNEDGSYSTKMSLALPDATALRVEYKVSPLGETGSDATIENSCSLSGLTSTPTVSKKSFKVKAASSETSNVSFGINITKYDASLKTRLRGATFTLYTVKSFDGNDRPELVKVDSKQTGGSGKVSFGDKESPLKPDVLYCFVETEAPEGYKISQPDPVYFVLKGTDTDAYNRVVENAKAHHAAPQESSSSFTVIDEKDDTPKPPTPDVPKPTPAPVEARLKVKKLVNGGDAVAADRDFSFSLRAMGEDGQATGDVLDTVTAKPGEEAEFSAVSFKKAGVYRYVISENGELGAGWTKAEPVIATVTVGAASDGTLSVKSVSYSKGDDAALFNNRYEQASGEFQLGLVKTVNGEAPLKGERFEFSATAEGENAAVAPELANVTTDKDGKAAFSVAELSDKQAGKTFTYRIHEVTDPAGGKGTWTKAADVIATVTVSERSSDNKLTAAVTYGKVGADETYEGAAAFDNVFTPAAATAEVRAGKASVNGRTDVKDGEKYTFGLYAKGEDGQRSGEALAKVTTELGKTEAFDASQLTYSEPGTYEYLVHEEDHNGGAGWAAVADIPVTVTVSTKGGTGSDARDLVATVAYGNDSKASAALFEDTYTATGSATLAVTKQVVGEGAPAGESFDFELKDSAGKVLSTASARAGETADFAPLSYTFADAGKTFEYTIHETGHDSGAWFKAADVKATVAVSDNGDGLLSTAVTYSNPNTDGASALFENAYGTVTFAPKLSKTVNGGVSEGKDQRFTFELEAVGGAPLPDDATLTIDGPGEGSFKAVTFAEPGIYRYRIHETCNLGEGWTNAPDVEVEVNVVRDEAARTLKVARVTYGGAEVETASFDNVYTPTTPGTPETPETPETPKTPDTPTAPHGGKTPKQPENIERKILEAVLPKTGDDTACLIAGTMSAGLVLLAVGLRMQRRKRA